MNDLELRLTELLARKADDVDVRPLEGFAETPYRIAPAPAHHDTVTGTQDLTTIDLEPTLRTSNDEVTMFETDTTSAARDSRHLWMIVAAATIIAVAAGALVFLVTDDDSTEPEVPAGPPSTLDPEATEAEQIVEAFIETRWSDPDQALTYVADDVTCSPESRCLPHTGHPALPTPNETSRTAESLRLEAALFEATGDNIVNVRCQQQDVTQSGIGVRCTYDYHTLRSEELGLGPFEQGPDDFVVRNGKIVAISPQLRFGLRLQFGEIWDDFRIWLSVQHPDDIALMYEADPPDQPLHGLDGWLFTEQSIALWERHTLEYVTDRTQVGIMGLPPVGAAPSTPETGELIVHMWSSQTSTAPWMRIFVYADGRLITQREGWTASGPRDEALYRETSYLERRLTPEGVEALWDYARSSGLFEADGEVVLNVGDVRSTCPRTLQVRNGDHLVSVTCTDGRNDGDPQDEATPEQLGWIVRLQDRLIDPASWLAPSAWEDYTATPYVASRYMVCIWYGESSVLPEAAVEVLAEGTPATHPHDPDNTSCTTLTTEQARQLTTALDEVGTRREGKAEISYFLVDAAGDDAGNMMLTPYLPHGQAPCIDCG